MWTRNTHRQPTPAGATLAALAALVTAGCASDPAPTHPLAPPLPAVPDSATPASPPPQASTPAPPPAAAATQVARRWLIAYHSRDYTDPGPDAWIDRVRGLVTDTLARRNERLRGRGGGGAWHQLVAGQCSTQARDITSVIPPEAPGTPALINVQLSGTLRTRCPAADTPTENHPVAATVLLRREHGRWKVHQKLY